uniref:Putative conserved secreted protein n=2 Tax=Ixodes ricinus TaxID=34613 RepID=V5ICT5_IXORI
MRLTACLAAAVALTTLSVIQQSNGACDVRPKPGVKPKKYPDMLKVYENGYKLTAEINVEGEKSTLFFHEYYSFDFKQGLLELTYRGITTNILYLHHTEEIFVFDNRSCVTFPITSPPKLISPLLLRWSSLFTGNNTIFGPSVLFLSPALNPAVRMTFQGSDEEVRGIQTIKWATCLKNSDDPYEVYFVDKKWNYGYGTGKTIPLRVRHGKVVTDIMRMQPYVRDPEQKLKIPMFVGCQRLARGFPKPPNFDNIPMEFHSELAFSNPTVNGQYSYTSHLDIIRDPVNNIFSHIFAPWNTGSGKLDQQLSALPETQTIFDVTNGIQYLKVPHYFGYEPFGRGKCYVSSRKDFRPVVQLPDNTTLSLLDTIAPSYETLKNANYLGIHVVRNAPVHVYEIVTTNVPVSGAVFSHAVITYCYLVEWIYPTFTSQRNLPIRVSMRAYSTNKNLKIPYFWFTANIHDISTAMEELNDKMNVMDCYDENEASYTWFQMGFPYTDMYEEFLRYSPQIKSKFLATFLRTTSLSPMRVPRVLVDITENMIYVTSLILERPLLETDYDRKKNFDLKDHQLKFGVVTLDECLKICSSADYPDCKAVAYCGASCYTSSLSSGGVDAGIVKSTDCTTYIKNDLSKKRKLPLTRDAIRKVETAVKESKFTFTVEDSTTFVVATLVAESTDDSLGSLSMTFRGDDRFGTPHSHRRDGEELDGFKTYSLKSRLLADVDGAVDLGSYPLNDCADICRDRPDCQFFSSCLVDSQCVISTIPARTSQWIETKLQCSTFAKSVKDNFELFSGISLDVGARKAVMTINDEECARLCMVETGFDCKSFDYCGQAKDMHTVCRLHDTHLREFGEPSKMNKKSLESCMHYSKKYLYDFKKSASNKTKASARTVIGQVTAEECAKQCRDATFLCENFDHCTGPQNLGRGDCMLYEKVDGAGPFQTVFSPICSSYSYRGDADLRSFSNQAALHSNATAGGLAFFLLLLGVGIGVSALLAYGYYKNRRLNRV